MVLSVVRNIARRNDPLHRKIRQGVRCLMFTLFIGYMVTDYALRPKTQRQRTETEVGHSFSNSRTLLDETERRSDYAACDNLTFPSPFCLCEELNSDTRMIADAFGYDAILDGAAFFHFLGMAYMFLALSIVCDEFFVPTLEVAADRLNLSNDVAGATLMAAGGSAPELATSFVGTFTGSKVGFGTIVGSAIFNVLFVIGMCVLMSAGNLKLSWYPLFRDCTVYAIGLLVLAIFFTVPDQGSIELWESFILLAMYFGYVYLMKNNEKLKERFAPESATKEADGEDGSVAKGSGADQEEGKDSEGGAGAGAGAGDGDGDDKPMRARNMRGGIMNLMLAEKPMIDAAGSHVVHKLKGDVRTTFDSIDKDKNGTICAEELRKLLEQLGEPTEKDVQDALLAIDQDDDKKISYDEFEAWYLRSEQRVNKEINEAFKELDDNKDGKLATSEIKTVLTALSPANEPPTDEQVEKAKNDLDKNDDGEISHEEFAEWYRASNLYTAKMENMKSTADGTEGIQLWKIPTNVKGKIWWVVSFPLMCPMYYTIPNVRSRRWEDWWVLSFFMSIVWVFIFSYFMVSWTTVLGFALGIPPILMGLVFLAAGTSVPDLITSVLVAMQGKGDMAVSSSIGSNIFDICVGLPLPWLVKGLATGGDTIPVGGPDDQIGLSVGILFGMIVLVVGTIKIVDWELNKKLASVFFFFYAVYLVQELVRFFSKEGEESCQ